MLPLRAAWLAIAALAAVQVVGHVGLAHLGTSPAAQLIAFISGIGLQYGTVLAVCVWTSRRWGSGRVMGDLGLRFRPADVSWAVIAWVAAVAGVGRLVAAFDAFGVPFESNNPFSGEAESAYAGVAQLAVLALVGLALVVAAPCFEELLCRGVILRGLRSRFPAAAAVTIQGIVFGAFHFDPARGAGNIGLVIILSAMGIVFGVLAERTGRLGSGMIAHAIQNGMVFAVGVATLY